MIKRVTFISEKNLRKDITLMLETVKEVLLKSFGKSIVGIYFKGSANKKWDSLIDYVPELSDIDIHVMFKNQKIYDSFCLDINKVLKLTEQLESLYFKKNKYPSHLPPLQLLSLNKIHSEEDYVPPVQSTVATIYGKEYSLYYNPKKHIIDIKKRSRKQILEHESVLRTIRTKGCYRYGNYLYKYLNELSWRLSSAGPNFLCLNNFTYENAWSLNRTYIVKNLKKLKYMNLAKSYHDYYYYAHRYFITKDSTDLRKAVKNGYTALDLMIKKAKKI
jgi:hypothetical protein